MEILSTVNLLIVIFLHTAHRQGMKKTRATGAGISSRRQNVVCLKSTYGNFW